MKPTTLLNKPVISTFVRYVKKAFRSTLYILGSILLITIILSFTDIPYWQYYWLGTYDCELEKEPDYIVLLGGGGMPSPDGFIRTYYTAGAWKRAPHSSVIIAIPSDASKGDESPELLMAREIIMRGVDSSIIQFETTGYNTVSQARAIADFFGKESMDTVALRLVTTPEHMLRSVKVFRKVGFSHVGGTPAFEQGLKEKKLKKEEDDSSVWLNFRYNIWSYMQYEITVVREYFAIVYYKLRGWM